MTDREFLIWIHERLVHVHGENELVDYMHKLRSIIANTDSIICTSNNGQGMNGMAELLEKLAT